MENGVKVSLLKMEIQKAENGCFLAEQRARASKRVGNEQGAKEHEAYLAELMGMIQYYKEQIAELEATH